MAVPFRRTGKTRKSKRRTHYKLTLAGVHTCPNCGAVTKSHRACRECGYYKDKVVVNRTKDGNEAV